MIRRRVQFLAVILSTAFSLVLFPAVERCRAQTDLQGWHTRGQTFLVWGNDAPGDTLCDIYASDQPISSLSGARWIGRCFSDNGANFRLDGYVTDARWILPDGSGGAVEVAADKTYFVVTPHETGQRYYAVVLKADTLVTAANSIGPIAETIDPAEATIQLQNDSLTVYAHWIDGRDDPESGRPAYPVMGNLYENGLGYNFALWEPQAPAGPGEQPLVVALHGGGGDLWAFAPHRAAGSYTRGLAGYLACLDDGRRSRDTLSLQDGVVNTFWYGYADEYDRFDPGYPGDSATVIDYTVRRMWWEIGWLMRQLPIDSARVTMMGASMGGNGSLLHTQFAPQTFGAALALVAIGTGPVNTSKYKLWGLEQQNLPTNLEGRPGIYDAFNWSWRLENLQQSGPDWPFTVILSGKQDTVAPWEEKPELYARLDSAATGCALYWDERQHGLGWFSAQFGSSEHIHASYLTRFRKDRSFPGFSNTDSDPNMPGRQPDPGDGTPENGDPWGTWGGYLEWDPETIEETPDSWAASLWVVSQSEYECDIPAADTIRADLTPRRLQQFQPQPGLPYRYELIREANGQLLQSGTVTAQSGGRITIPGLRLIKEPARLTIFRSLRAPEAGASGRPKAFRLFQNVPNPFNASTAISFQLAASAHVRLTVFNVRGQVVGVLLDEERPVGVHRVRFHGQGLSSGFYFCRLQTGAGSETRKMVLLK